MIRVWVRIAARASSRRRAALHPSILLHYAWTQPVRTAQHPWVLDLDFGPHGSQLKVASIPKGSNDSAGDDMKCEPCCV